MAETRHGSILAQMALLIALALLIAHAVSYFVILDERQRLMMSDTSSIGIQRFVEALKDLQSAGSQDDIDAALREHATPGFRLIARRGDAALPSGLEHEPQLTARLRRTLDAADIEVRSFSVAVREAGPLRTFGRPPPFDRGPGTSARAPNGEPPFGSFAGSPPRPPGPMREVVFSAELNNGVWVSAASIWRQPNQSEIARFIAMPIVFYITILIATLWLARRIMRPLRKMAQTASQVGRPGPPPRIAPHGPSEVRALIGAFNAMAARVSTLLQQKDELLGAIGHDLRTPLSSLRVRAESIADDSVRQPIIETIDELTRLLEDTLDIARLGHTTEAPRLVDVTALVDAVAEEYRSRGAPVEFSEDERVTILCRTGLTRRLLRNLIDNAIKYGARADLKLSHDDVEATLLIRDEGPGVAPEALERMTEPFVRLEPSRNRGTGGAGLGLAIAARIAEVEGATLQFLNSEQRGLIVSVSWPIAPARTR